MGPGISFNDQFIVEHQTSRQSEYESRKPNRQDPDNSLSNSLDTTANKTRNYAVSQLLLDLLNTRL